MNERIKELKKQAEEYAALYGLTNKIYGQALIDVLDEKFAELIVQECAVYCAGHILPTKMAEEHDLNYNDGVLDCAIGLKQHFGHDL